MTETNLISSDQIEGYPHPKVTKKLFGHQFAEQEFLPDEITGTKFYEPGENSKEKNIRDFLKFRWKDKYDY